MRTDCIRVILVVELPGYVRQKSDVYKFSYGTLNDDNEGLAALIYMQYKEVEKMNKDSVSVGYNLYKSVLADNERLRDEIKRLEKDLDTWKQASIENHNSYLSAMRGYEEYQQKYVDEKMEHRKTKSRIVYAKDILSGNKDRSVMKNNDFIDSYGEP